jgi:hypothetical protein
VSLSCPSFPLKPCVQFVRVNVRVLSGRRERERERETLTRAHALGIHREVSCVCQSAASRDNIV